MLKFAVVISALVAVAHAAPAEETVPVNEIPIIENRGIVDEPSTVEYRGLDETATVDDRGVVEETTPIPILWESVQGPNSDGSYSWIYEAGNGVKAQEKGTPKEIGTGDDATVAMVAEGQYSYVDKDGNLIELTYVADENGFRAMGAHLPTPPPMPPAISRALEWIAAQPKTTPTPPREE